MKLSHIHLAFIDYPAAVAFFTRVLKLNAVEETNEMALFRCEGFDIALHPDWGQGDTAATIAFQSKNCKEDYLDALKNGAISRSEPRQKTGSIKADVFGPGKLVIEFEQVLD